MGLDSFDSDKQTLSPDTTIGELVEHYGEEAVRRGLKYIDNLSDADENYRKAVTEDGEELKEGIKEKFNSDGSEELDEVSKKWADSMEDTGLGISDE
jgi:hypothetical protein